MVTIRYLQSIGMSCQTRHQVERFTNSPLGQSAGLEIRTSLFDWISTPLHRNSAFIDQGLPEYQPGSVIEDQGRAYWTTPGFHVFHSFRIREGKKTRLDIENTFEKMTQKFRAQREKFRQTDVSNTCFVLGNTQNNLVGEVFHISERHHYVFDSAGIDTLHRSLDRFFGQDCQLIVVTSPDRFSGNADKDNRVRIIDRGDSEWKGPDAEWDRALCDHLGLEIANAA